MTGARRHIGLLVLLLCSVMLPTQSAARKARVEMPHYSFDRPAERGWRLRRPAKQQETAILTKRVAPFTFQIQAMVNPILDSSLQQASPAEIADDFRRREEQIMIEQGVRRGLYELRDLTLGETYLGGKTFYTMDYVIESGTGLQRASLSLCFPREEGNRYFILLHYSETVPAGTVLLSSYRREFEAVLKSLRFAE